MKELKLNLGQRPITLLLSNNDWISVRSMCEAIGLAHQPQQVKLKQNPSISWNDIVSTGADGKQYNMLCIPVNEVGYWLCLINANKVKPELKDELIKFQKNLQILIHAALTGAEHEEIVKSLNGTIEVLRAENLDLARRLEVAEDKLNDLDSFKDDVRYLMAQQVPPRRHLSLVGSL